MTDTRNELARARDAWMDTPEGRECVERDGARGQYLRNRLERAFVAGWNAAQQQPTKLDCVATDGCKASLETRGA